jgi:tripartite-type tricarboxylate transporter receptor subunit TctC
MGRGVFAPAATPPAIVEKLVQAVTNEMSAPEVVARLEKAGTDNPVAGAELGRRLAQDHALFAEIVKRDRIKPE